jgi:hypothetical protein
LTRSSAHSTGSDAQRNCTHGSRCRMSFKVKTLYAAKTKWCARGHPSPDCGCRRLRLQA